MAELVCLLIHVEDCVILFQCVKGNLQPECTHHCLGGMLCLAIFLARLTPIKCLLTICME